MNIQNLLKGAYAFICLSCFVLQSCSSGSETKIDNTALHRLETSYLADLDLSINHLDSMFTEREQKQLQYHYKKSRIYFKRIEPVLAATDKDNYKSLNAPNLIKVEEEDLTDIKIIKPYGFQVLEELLFSEEPIDTIKVFEIAHKTQNRLKLIRHNVHLRLEKRHVLWLLRDAFVRVATTGITGFDSPVLSNSIEEANIVYHRLEEILGYYKGQFKNKTLYRDWMDELQRSQHDLNGDFETFDRYSFLKNHTQKQMKMWVMIVKDWEVEYSFEMALKTDATSLFSDSTFNLKYFADYQNEPYNRGKIQLGEELFNDKYLSGKNNMSCATCHQKNKAFADGLKTFENQRRNTPTVAYAGLQQGFFYDMRAGSLEGQIVSVVNNKNEFHSNLKELASSVGNNPKYKSAFDSLYNGKITDANVRNAIATYIRSLSPFNSKFDRNINELENTLSDKEINGFNLFMGKAACATCHFPPVFNGTVPPNFTESEIEMPGVPKTTKNPATIDDDFGRYDLFQTEERKHFFKTPTIRNVSLTAPYMHNGVYKTLEEVMDFYNNGGGAGLGIILENQTLPTDSLHLTRQEIKDIIAFLNTLTDKGFEGSE